MRMKHHVSGCHSESTAAEDPLSAQTLESGEAAGVVPPKIEGVV
jgi:hypothetical protein